MLLVARPAYLELAGTQTVLTAGSSDIEPVLISLKLLCNLVKVEPWQDVAFPAAMYDCQKASYLIC